MGTGRRGVILLFASGVVVLLLILTMTFLGLARSGALWGSGGVLPRAQSLLAAASGCEYAAGRLARSGYPVFAGSPAERGGDWRSLDPYGTALSDLINPSFAHGEPWADSASLAADGLDNDADGLVDEAGEGGGVFTAGEGWLERDGDGRFSAWSGRVRSGGDRLGVRFLLRVDGVDGKIPVNGGVLTAPAYNQAAFGTFHVALEHALNGLGAVVRPLSEAPPLGWVRRLDLPTCGYAAGNPGQPFRMSWLGADLIRSRPLGGYRSLDLPGDPLSVRATLAALGYRKEDLDRILPFLDVGPYETPAEMEGGLSPWTAQPCALVSIAAAPREVLQALWMHHIAAWGPSKLPGLGADWDRVSTRTCDDPSVASSACRFRNLCAFIDPEEAGRLADAAIALRAAGDYSWNGLYRAIAEQAPEIFERDWKDLDPDGNPATASRNQVSWIQLKTDLAFQAVSLDLFPVKYSNTGLGAPHFPVAAWAHWGIDREQAAGFQGSPGIGLSEIARAYLPNGYPGLPPDPANPWPAAGTGPYNPYATGQNNNSPLRLSMAPPSRFSVACLARGGGVSAEVAGRFRAAEQLDFATQEDFESLAGGVRLARRGLETAGTPSPLLRMDGGSGAPAVTSLPFWNRGSGQPSDFGVFSSYPRSFGALGLSEAEAGLVNGAKIYLPFAEDFDGSVANNYRTQTAGPPYPQAAIAVAGPGMWDGASRSPYGMTGIACVLPQCPGIEGSFAAGSTVRELSIECWMGPGATISVESSFIPGQPNRIRLQKRRILQDPGLVLTEYRVNVRWHDPLHFTTIETTGIHRIEERDQTKSGDVGRVSDGSHVVLALRRLGTGLPGDELGTECRLFVNGRDHPDGTPMVHIHEATTGLPPALVKGGRLQVTDQETLRVPWPFPTDGYGVDEIRLYDRALGQGDALALFRLGRFKRKGTFTSPLYVPDAPARLQMAQWTGIVPAELRSDLSDPASVFNPFDVRVQGYADRFGAVPLGPPVPLGETSGDVRLLSGEMGSVRSFRYLVTMDCSAADGVLNETPIFESIWITLQRQGTAPAWTTWEPR